MVKVKEKTALHQAVQEIKKKNKKNKVKPFIELSKELKNEKNKSINSSARTEKEEEERGIIYIGHIPHGFYEQQIKNFFKQFGVVLKVRVARSKKTGRSKGYAYVLFKNPIVAKVAADAMNNYLMCGRLLKANFIPKEKQNMRLFFGENYHRTNYPRLHNVKETIKMNHRSISKSKQLSKVKATKKKLAALENKLKSKGINLTFDTVC